MNKGLKLAVIGVATVAALSTSACGAQDSSNTSDILSRYAVTLPDDTKVDCMFLDTYKATDLNCFWESPSTATATKDGLKSGVAEGSTCIWYDAFEEAALDCKEN